MIAGVDYGSRYSGNTVVAVLQNMGVPDFYCTARKQDADRFLVDLIAHFPEAIVAMDAPLSLPGVYRNMKGRDDFFYRACDRALQAMSPMFLGGLTARAMQLVHDLQSDAITFYEVYPAGAARDLHLPGQEYKKERTAIEKCAAILQEATPFPIDPTLVATWHHFDALLALWIGLKIQSGASHTAGDPEEGLIHY